MYLVKTPLFIQNLFPNFVWRMPATEQKIYLTFDDGPVPDVTPWVLDLLSQYDAKASFFCVGNNVERHPQLLSRIVREGHSIGNHTHNHLSGWASENIPYFHNVRKCATLIRSELFRPPYGRLKPLQAQFLQRHYAIVMWDVLSGDFDKRVSNEQCLNNVRQHAQAGSIVVFHDSFKAEKRLRYALPRVLDHFASQGYSFDAIRTEALAARPSGRRSA